MMKKEGERDFDQHREREQLFLFINQQRQVIKQLNVDLQEKDVSDRSEEEKRKLGIIAKMT